MFRNGQICTHINRERKRDKREDIYFSIKTCALQGEIYCKLSRWLWSILFSILQFAICFKGDKYTENKIEREREDTSRQSKRKIERERKRERETLTEYMDLAKQGKNQFGEIQTKIHRKRKNERTRGANNTKSERQVCVWVCVCVCVCVWEGGWKSKQKNKKEI